jgi:hypothetical protein
MPQTRWRCIKRLRLAYSLPDCQVASSLIAKNCNMKEEENEDQQCIQKKTRDFPRFIPTENTRGEKSFLKVVEDLSTYKPL